MGLVIIILLLGALVSLVGWIWFLYVAFNESIPWGIGCLLNSFLPILPIVPILFLVMHGQDAGKPFGVVLLGGAIMFLARYAVPRKPPVDSRAVSRHIVTPTPPFTPQTQTSHRIRPRPSRVATQPPKISAEQRKLNESLRQAVAKDDLEQIKLAISQGADINVKDVTGSTPLMMATSDSNKEAVELLIANRADVDATNGVGWTALRIATMGSYKDVGVHKDIMELLITGGADVNLADNSDITHLHQAVIFGNKDIIELLIDSGADVNATDVKGVTPLHTAAGSGKKDIFELLKAKGAKISNLHLAAYVGDLAKAKDFIQEGASVSAKDFSNRTPLHFAGSKDVAELLISKGADVNAKGIFDGTPLCYAVDKGCIEVVEVLIARGADVNAERRGAEWMTPLHLAADKGERDIAELLIAKGANVNTATKPNRKTARQIARDRGHQEIVELLNKHGATEQPLTSWEEKNLTEALSRAIRKGDYYKVRALISNGVDVNAKNKRGYTPLYEAAREGQKDIGDLLIENGAVVSGLHVAVFTADIDRIESLWGRGVDLIDKDDPMLDLTPWHFVYSEEAAEFLIAKGLNINIKDRLGQTALHYAAKQGRKALVELLLAKGANIDAVDNYTITSNTSWMSSDRIRGSGHTPLHWAAYNGHKDVVELLIASGADINAAHKDGMTALQLANDKEHAGIVELLSMHGAEYRPVLVTKSWQPIVSISPQSQGRSKSTTTVGAAPSFTLRDLDGKQISLSDFEGKVIILDFWATWCPPCVKEIPHFISLYKQYKNKGFVMLGISLDREGVDVVRSFVQKYRINYPIMMANSKVRRDYGGITSIPTTFVINSEGQMHRKYVGYRDKAVFRADLKELLADVRLSEKPMQIEETQRTAITYPNAAETKVEYEIAFTSRRDGNAEIYITNVDGSEQINITKNRAHDLRSCWSPDGREIAFVSNRDGNYEIYIMNLDGSQQRRLTKNKAVDVYPSWSLDGSKIAFVSEREGNNEIYIMNVDGGELKRVTNNPATDTNPSWSPDGMKIAFVSNRDGNYEIHVMNLNDGKNINLTNNSAWDGLPAWSPDGKKISFTSERDGNYEIYVMNAGGSQQTRLTDNKAEDMGPTWSPDGQRIAFYSKRDGNNEIYIMSLNGSDQKRVTNNRAVDSNPSWLPFLPTKL